MLARSGFMWYRHFYILNVICIFIGLLTASAKGQDTLC